MGHQFLAIAVIIISILRMQLTKIAIFERWFKIKLDWRVFKLNRWKYEIPFSRNIFSGWN